VRYETSESTLAQIMGGKTDDRLSLFDTPVNTYTLRHLRDAVQNIQLNWVKCACVDIPNMKNAVNALMHRFGRLALEAAPSQVMNDQGSIEDAGAGLLAMNRICLRR
jgi:hypothetical protein